MPASTLEFALIPWLVSIHAMTVAHYKNSAVVDQPRKKYIFFNKENIEHLIFFVFFFLYGSWETLDSLRILPRGAPTFSTPGKAIPRLFEKSTFQAS